MKFNGSRKERERKGQTEKIDLNKVSTKGARFGGNGKAGKPKTSNLVQEYLRNEVRKN